MDRLPFDPDRLPPAETTETPARRERRQYASMLEARQLTVTELNQLIRTTLETRIARPLRVIGQVSNLSAAHHWYYSLKDDTSVVSCVTWASTARRFGFVPGDGDEVVATGYVSHYGQQGRTQLYVDKLEPVGAGALQLQFKAMCAELRKLGYFETGRKRRLPLLPRRVALVTSARGAAVHDVLTTAAARCPAVGWVLVDVRVQGDGAAEDVARTIRWVDANAERLGIDAILVTRGGGSMEDLQAFNERVVADAVYGCARPVVAAIGHESDTTVIELVADVRAATPTQAAMRLVPDAAELRQQTEHLAHRLAQRVERRLESERHRLERRAAQLSELHQRRVANARLRLSRLLERYAQTRPEAALRERRERVTRLATRLESVMRSRLDVRPELDRRQARLRLAGRRRLDAAERSLAALTRELAAVDPRRVLGRGFSITTGRDGSLVRKVGDVKKGQPLRTHVVDGVIDSVVAGSASRRRRAPAPSADQMDLFGGSE